MAMELARRNMLTQQIRANRVIDEQILGIIDQTPREFFVPEPFRTIAYADTQIPIGQNQVMLSPREEGIILQALAIKPEDTILEIGTGSGYFTYLLAQLGRFVNSVDIIPDFIAQAKIKLAEKEIRNVHLEVGDASQNWDKEAPYDVICITGSLPFLPDTFKSILAPQGRIFAFIGDAPAMSAQLITQQADTHWHIENYYETVIEPLIHASIKDKFIF